MEPGRVRGVSVAGHRQDTRVPVSPYRVGHGTPVVSGDPGHAGTHGDTVGHQRVPAISLRPYQHEAASAAWDTLVAGQKRRTLLVLPTGCGKTIVFAEVARRFRAHGRVLVLAHREELIRQACDKVTRTAGLRCGVEMASETSAGGEDVVVATVQTLSRPGRLAGFAPDEFALVVVDEAHHATAASYRAVLDYFASARVLGVTATPDRADGTGLGEVFEHVAFTYEIRDAIDDGYLVPIRQRAVHVAGLDLSRVRVTAGDLNEGDLARVLTAEDALHRVAVPAVELAGERPTLVFAASVEHARCLAEVMQRYTQRGVLVLHGGTEAEVRREALAGFAAGRAQFLVNCALFTEGFDEPRIACVAVARPTRSRALYAQMIGRGTRLHEGKADLLVLDFRGNAGRHSLASAADVLGGRERPEVLARAKERLESGELAVHEALDAARAEVAEETRRKVLAQARYQARDVDPFTVLGAAPRPTAYAGLPATDKQRAALERFRVDVDLATVSRGEASALLDQLVRRAKSGRCTYRQARVLARYGMDTEVSFDEATRLIDTLARNRWRPVANVAGVAP